MSLGQDPIEEILLRLPVKDILRYKLVSKGWKLMTDSQYFKERHLKHQQLYKPDLILMVDQDGDNEPLANEEMILRTLVYANDHHLDRLVEQEAVSLQIPFDDVSKSLDGIICIYHSRGSIVVVNPSTRWFRVVPQARIQELSSKRSNDDDYKPNLLGFGKDKITRTYKLVWLYKALESDPQGATTCEVFGFNTNLWRQVESPRYRIFEDQSPIYFNGSLHWLVYEANNAVKILSFDCHTEVFGMISESPITEEDEDQVIMCDLNNRLCVSEKKWPRQDVWALNTSNMTWEKIYSLNLSSSPNGFLGDETWPIFSPIAIMKKKKMLLFDENEANPKLVIYDLKTRSYSLYFNVQNEILIAPYFQSLISIN